MLSQWLSHLTQGGLFAAAAILSIPIGTVFLECAAALLPPRSSRQRALPERATVLIPAHNEAAVISQTLTSVMAHRPDRAEVCVVADNCSDETVAIAQQFGVTVIERHNQAQRGKGYALDYGLSHLADNPPEVVVMVDADCSVEAETMSLTMSQAHASQRPVQALYLMEMPPEPSAADSISALAFLVKNWVRPAGLDRLGLPCLLTGTGMAFPWSVIRSAPLASGNIVEDMQLGLDLAIAGYPPQFCAAARLTGRLPSDKDAAKEQRTRWEHGQLSTLLTQVPRLLKQAALQRRVDLLALALEMAVPPLSLLVLLWLSLFALAWGAAFIGLSHGPEIIFSIEGSLMAIAIVAAWAKFG
ncbi:MAG: glycosyltransferase, partial [Cyanobacteria bacterium P01_A01_bin.135]